MSRINRIAVDFDGTLSTDAFPDVGTPVPYAIETIKELTALGIEVYLWTCRSGDRLGAAVGWCEGHGLRLSGYNKAPCRRANLLSCKLDADRFIDDRAMGCPIMVHEGRKVVDWIKVRALLRLDGVALGFATPTEPEA